LTAIGNAPEPEPTLVEAVRRLLDDPSPLVRGTAVWALGRLAEARQVAVEAGARLAAEPDPEVRAEWQLLALPAAP
jgi:epoxyqueuosine reductase